MSELTDSNLERRVLILATADSEADRIQAALASAALAGERVLDANSVCHELERGAGVVVLTDDNLVPGQSCPLIACLWRQPLWSDLPIILLARGGAESPMAGYAMETLGNVLPLDRGVSPSTLASAVRTALRARQRQYQARQHQAERAAAEQALQQSQQQLNLVTSTAPIAILYVDAQQRFTFANNFIAARMRLHPSSMIGRTVREVVGDDYERFAGPLEQALAGQEISCELERFYPAVGHRHMHASFVPDFDEAGQVRGTVVVLTDITEHKQAREAVQTSERKFRTIFESTQEGILLLDDNRIILELNPAAVMILGIPMDRIVGHDIGEFVESSVDVAPLWALAMDEGCYYGEHVIQRPDGERRELEVVGVSQVLPHKHLLVAHDITDRKQIERELKSLNETLEQQVGQRTAEAEERARLLQQLAAELTQAEHRERRRLSQMLHDHLQQLLVAARLRVGMLRERVRAKESKHAVQQVDDLLQESIKASRSLTVELSPPILFDAGLAPALEWLARRMGDDHDLYVQVEVDDRAEPASEGTQAFLFQAVRELLFNVVKHARVDRARVKMSVDAAHNVVIAVEDDGPGFDPQVLKQRQDSGEAFGLSSIQQRLQFLGGAMELDTACGRGTRIRLTVPIGSPDVEQVLPADLPPEIVAHGPLPSACEAVTGGARSIRVLLADDHKILREGLARMLREQADMEVVAEASDGQEAVRLAFETRPDVVIMDTSMPCMNGIEATRRILASLPWIRVIGLSMHDREHMSNIMRDAGAVAYFTKDGPSEELIAAIRQHAPMLASPPLTRGD